MTIVNRQRVQRSDSRFAVLSLLSSLRPISWARLVAGVSPRHADWSNSRAGSGPRYRPDGRRRIRPDCSVFNAPLFALRQSRALRPRIGDRQGARAKTPRSATLDGLAFWLHLVGRRDRALASHNRALF